MRLCDTTHAKAAPLAALTALTLATTATAQISYSDRLYGRGMASVWPAGLLTITAVDTSPPTPDPSFSRPRTKEFGDQSAYPQLATDRPINAADLGLEALYDAYLGFPSVEIDAISTGCGVIPNDANDDGVPDLTTAWMAVSISVADGVTGDVGSYWERADTFYGSAGSEILSYYFAQSAGSIDPALPGTVQLEMSRSHLNVGSWSQTSPHDVVAFDYALGAQQIQGNLSGSPFFGTENVVFFSVTKEWADAIAANPSAPDVFRDYIGAGSTYVDPNGTDIYCMEWIDGPNGTPGSWTEPWVWASGSLLGFDRQTGDLDAFDLDIQGSPKRYNVIFSGNVGDVVDGIDDQLLYIDLSEGTSGGNGIMAAQNPPDPNNPGQTINSSARALGDQIPNGPVVKVTDRVDLDPDGDEIDSICTIEPESGNLGLFAGTAVAHDVVAGRNPVHLSMFRTDDPNFDSDDPNTTEWRIQVTGWGTTTPQDCVVEFQQYNGTILPATTPPATGWTVVGSAWRSSAMDALEYDYTRTVGTSGQDWAIKVVLKSKGVEIARSWICAMED